MKAPDHVKTPAQYIASLSEPRRQAVRTLHDAIVAAAPELKPHLCSGMLGYGPYHYRYASGREGDSSIVALASQKQHLSLYFSCVQEDDLYLAEKNAHRLGKVSVGRCCVRFKKLEDLNLPVAMELVAEAAKLAKRSGVLK